MDSSARDKSACWNAAVAGVQWRDFVAALSFKLVDAPTSSSFPKLIIRRNMNAASVHLKGLYTLLSARLRTAKTPKSSCTPQKQRRKPSFAYFVQSSSLPRCNNYIHLTSSKDDRDVLSTYKIRPPRSSYASSSPAALRCSLCEVHETCSYSLRSIIRRVLPIWWC